MAKPTPEGLAAIGQALFGQQWQRELARHLSVGDRSVRRYLAGSRGIPDWMAGRLRELGAERTENIQAVLTRYLPA